MCLDTSFGPIFAAATLSTPLLPIILVIDLFQWQFGHSSNLNVRNISKIKNKTKKKLTLAWGLRCKCVLSPVVTIVIVTDVDVVIVDVEK